MGLIEVLCSYDVDQGVLFEIYVLICICGLMIDEICCGDWVLCLVYCCVCDVVVIICCLEQSSGCVVSVIEVVVVMEMLLFEYLCLMEDVVCGQVLSLELCIEDQGELDIVVQGGLIL